LKFGLAHCSTTQKFIVLLLRIAVLVLARLSEKLLSTFPCDVFIDINDGCGVLAHSTGTFSAHLVDCLFATLLSGWWLPSGFWYFILSFIVLGIRAQSV
jgi:hypothetical protein